MSAPYLPDFTTGRYPRQCSGCAGLLYGIYRRRIGRRTVQTQFRCTRCKKITEYRPRQEPRRDDETT